MKLFNFDYKFWKRLDMGEIQNVIAYAVSKRTVKELEEEQEIVRARLELAQRNSALAAENLEVHNGILAAAILTKKF